MTGLEPADLEAIFRNGIKVRLQFEQNSRWCLWVKGGGAWKRRKDFATPYAEHGCRTAEEWYGPPVSDWRPVEEETS
jgi:hypothetical protein